MAAANKESKGAKGQLKNELKITLESRSWHSYHTITAVRSRAESQDYFSIYSFPPTTPSIKEAVA